MVRGFKKFSLKFLVKLALVVSLGALFPADSNAISVGGGFSNGPGGIRIGGGVSTGPGGITVGGGVGTGGGFYGGLGGLGGLGGMMTGEPYYHPLISLVACSVLGIPTGSFGALVMIVAGIFAIVAAAMGSYKMALSTIVIGAGAWILYPIVTLFFALPC